MDIFKTYATDDVKEQDGIWRELGDGKILVARAFNTQHAKYFSTQVEAHKRLLDSKTPEADKMSDKIVIDAMSKFVFLGFENLQYNGKPLENNLETRVMLLQHKDFRRVVNEIAQDHNNYLMYQEEEATKNSAST